MFYTCIFVGRRICIYIYIYTYTLTLRIAYMHIIMPIYTRVHLHVFYAITYIEIYNLCACATARLFSAPPC